MSALVGASLMNLVDAVIREQGSLPPEKRRGVSIVVDEMQAMPGVDYESMLGELGKFGASLFPRNAGTRQAGRPLADPEGHPALQRGVSGRLPGGRRGREAPRMGAGQGPDIRGRHHLPAGASLLRAGDRRRGASSGLLDGR